MFAGSYATKGAFCRFLFLFLLVGSFQELKIRPKPSPIQPYVYTFAFPSIMIFVCPTKIPT